MPAECLPVPESILKAGLPKPRRQRNIGEPEVLVMAELLSQRLNDTEACQVSGINYNAWIKWKSRNRDKLGHVLARTMGETIRENFECIKAARSKDWRAARELLSLHAPERFNDRLNSAPQVQVNVMAGQALSKVVSSVWSGPRSACEAKEPVRAIGQGEPAQAITGTAIDPSKAQNQS